MTGKEILLQMFMFLGGCVSGVWDPHSPSGLAGGDIGDSLQDDLRWRGIQPQVAQAGCPGSPGLPHTVLQHCQVDSSPEVFFFVCLFTSQSSVRPSVFSRVSGYKARDAEYKGETHLAQLWTEGCSLLNRLCYFMFAKGGWPEATLIRTNCTRHEMAQSSDKKAGENKKN